MWFEIGDIITIDRGIFHFHSDKSEKGTFKEAGCAKRIGNDVDFDCLAWSEGIVTYIQRTDKFIISGPFSGCYMVAFDVEAEDDEGKLSNGRYVAHIGTGSPKETAAVKGAWKEFVKTEKNGVKKLWGFNPYDAYVGYDLSEACKKGYGNSYIYGIMPPAPSESSLFFSLLLYEKNNKDKDNKYVVGDIKHISSMDKECLVELP